jgi:hypothetical protein
MANLKVTYATKNNIRGVVNRVTAPKRVWLRQNGGSNIAFSLPYGPQGVEFKQLGATYKTIQRPTLKPVLVAEHPQLRMVTFTALIADQNSEGFWTTQSALDSFEILADEDVDISFSYGLVALPYKVRMTQLDYKTLRRDLDGNITQASVSVQLTESVQLEQVLTQLTAVTYTPVPDGSPPRERRSTPVDLGDELEDPPACQLSDLNCADYGKFGQGGVDWTGFEPLG